MYLCMHVRMYGGYLRRGPVGQRVGSEQRERELSKESTFLVDLYVCKYVCMYTCTYLGGMDVLYVCTAHP